MSYGGSSYGGFPYAGWAAGGVLLPPANLVIAPAVNSAVLTWDAVTDATGYKVRVDGGAETDIGNVLTHLFTGLTPSTLHLFEVMAYNADDESLWSSIEGTTYDRFEVTVNGGDPIVVEDLCDVIDGLEPGTVTTVCVALCNEACCSEYACIEVSTCPNPVVLGTVTTTLTTIELCWTAAPLGVPFHYEVQIDGGDPVVLDDTTLCYTFTGLTQGTEHTVSVRVCTESCCSDYASTTTTTKTRGWSPCPCGPGWRIEVCNLRTGIVRGILLPTAMDFQVMKNTVGRGSLTLPVRTVRALDVWPDFTSVYITREGMDPANDDCLFAGIVREVNGDNGTVQVGMDSIESYLWRRRLLRDLSFAGIGQNQIAAALVAETITNGIPLTGTAQTPGTLRTRDYLEADRAYIGPLLEQFTESLDGPSWRLVHTRTGGAWSTQIVFADEVGDYRNTVLTGDREGTGYGLNLNSQDHATWVDGFNQATPPLTSHADDLVIYPAFDADPTFDAPLQGTLDEQTQGYLNVRGDISAVPSFQLSGEAIKADQMRLGDTAEFHLDQGFIAYHGRAEVAGITYRIAEGSPLTRDLALIPVDTAVEAVMNATSTAQCQSCR